VPPFTVIPNCGTSSFSVSHASQARSVSWRSQGGTQRQAKKTQQAQSTGHDVVALAPLRRVLSLPQLVQLSPHSHNSPPSTEMNEHLPHLLLHHTASHVIRRHERHPVGIHSRNGQPAPHERTHARGRILCNKQRESRLQRLPTLIDCHRVVAEEARFDSANIARNQSDARVTCAAHHTAQIHHHAPATAS